jgi:ribonucleoside-diphosphate reductase alpha subunit
MYVIKRSGEREPVFFDKITQRNATLCADLSIDPIKISQKVIESIHPGIRTEDLDILSAETALYMSTMEPEYEVLAKRITISNAHKNIPASFKTSTERLYNIGILDENYAKFVFEFGDKLDEMIDHKRDYDLSYFGYKTLEKSYLTREPKYNKETGDVEEDELGNILERPQHVFMRTSVFLHYPNLEKIKKTYDLMSNRVFTHASPTLFNAGFKYSQLSSCFLLSMEDDLKEMYGTMTNAAMISKFSGGIGINISMIRSKGSNIKSTGGKSDGIVPFLKVWNSTARYVNQGGRRKGAVAVYLEPHHADVYDFLKIRKNNTKEEEQCLDLHIAMWVSDLFMKRVMEDGVWSLFDPAKLSKNGYNLHDAYGTEFERQYLEAESKKLYRRQVKAQELWKEILFSQMETGEPYVLFKDHINHKSNQKNLGTIRGSNLCAEIVEYTDKDTIAVCNLASISLPSFVDKENRSFDYKRLGDVVETITENMNIVIDKNFYPVDEARKSNMTSRPIGIGAQGLADVFQMLKYSWDDQEAKEINSNIYATIYYHSLKASIELAKINGSYTTFKGSPFSQGKFQHDLCNEFQGIISHSSATTLQFDWDTLRDDVQKYGTMNSLLTTQMPTASTAQILGNNESMEPYTSNMYIRRVLSGDFPVINQHLYEELKSIGLWNKEIVNEIMRYEGSIQLIEEIPKRIRDIYRTAWEIKTKRMVDFALDRGLYIDQTQSFNVFMDTPTVESLSSMFVYSWSRGMKTGMYYLRRKPKVSAIKFTVSEKSKPKEQQPKQKRVCTDDVCISCSS